jgi:membrane fusion protein, multidrug efflux system
VGQTLGGSDIQIMARVQGYLTGIHFKEGSQVKKGQLLYTIDPLPYQTNVDQAKGQLAEALAMFAQAESDLERIKPLAKINAVSQRDLVAAQAKYDAAVARKQSGEAIVRNAQIELGYAYITSPLDGIIGISQAQEGDFVGTVGLRLLNTVSNNTTIRVRFSVTEAEYIDFRKRVTNKENFDWTVDMVLGDGSLHPQKGIINFANREIDPSTGTLTLEATFPNADGILRPGQFAKVRFVIETRKDAMLVPLRAVTELQGNYMVNVITAENKVEVKMVKAGSKFGEYWIIESGLNPTDKVALIGNMALKANTVVTPVPVKIDSTIH